MKRTLEVALYSVMLSTLAATGADFSRAELNAKLDALAQSTPSPPERRASMSCYLRAFIELRRIEYICPECGKRTYYSIPKEEDRDHLQSYRGRVEPLRKLGLDISLDENPYCRFCIPDALLVKEKTEPIAGEIAQNSDRLPAGRQVTVVEDLGKHYNKNRYIIDFKYGYVARDSINDIGMILKNTHIHCYPVVNNAYYQTLSDVHKGDVLEKLPPLPNDPDSWVRVAHHDLRTAIDADQLINIQEAPIFNVMACWSITIDGKQRKIPVDSFDSAILTAFLTGKEWVMNYNARKTVALKDCLPRLQILLGSETPITDTKNNEK